MAVDWMYRGDDPPRWVRSRDSAFWYLRRTSGQLGDGTSRYLLSSFALGKDRTIKARNPQSAQDVADAIITASVEVARRDREHYHANRVWVVTYRDPHDSTYVGVWGVYRTAERAGTEADSCENAERAHVEVSECGLNYPGGTD